MLDSIALTASTVCTAHACTKRLDETLWPETRDETYWAETQTYSSETETRRDRDETLVHLETVSRPRRLDRDYIPDRKSTFRAVIPRLHD